MSDEPAGPVDLRWLLGQIRDGRVGIYPDRRYYATTVRRGVATVVLCDDEVHLLEDAGVVVFEPDGPVSLTWHAREGNNRGGLLALAAAAQRRQAREVRDDVFLAPDIQAAA